MQGIVGATRQPMCHLGSSDGSFPGAMNWRLWGKEGHVKMTSPNKLIP